MASRMFGALVTLAIMLQAPCYAAEFNDADYAEHVAALKQQLPDGFSVFIERPFVVASDMAADKVQASCERTVRWAVQKLKAEYFSHDPAEILTIYLFKDDDSYRRNAILLLDDEPTTPYGYYSHSHKALVMNIATGGGTLVHEIVHPYIHANFSRCPAWLNEGLGSLYEQSAERKGRIIGLTNWRLAGLQRAIKAGRVPSFKQLTSTTDDEFYNKDKGTNYAQARYLCYYLQEHGLLRKFYHNFVANQRDDPTGYDTVVKTLGERDMDAFQKKWEAYVMGLRFP